MANKTYATVMPDGTLKFTSNQRRPRAKAGIKPFEVTEDMFLKALKEIDEEQKEIDKLNDDEYDLDNV